MVGKNDVGFPKKCAGNLKEQLIRTTLRNVRSRGHPYVELREDGKKLIFFCTLCLAPCYSDSVLFDHLRGNLHTGRLATARATLMKSNPWPFSDGVFFFHDDSNEHNKLLLLDTERVGADGEDSDALPIVQYDNQLVRNCSVHVSRNAGSHILEDDVLLESNEYDRGTCEELVIPELLLKEDVTNLVVRHIGIGRIGARLVERDGAFSQIHRIWCEWLGNKPISSDDNIGLITKHDFALVIFPYNYNLGRVGVYEDFRYLLPSSPYSQAENSSNSRGKKRKSFSDPEGVNQEGSSGEDSCSSNSSSSKTLLAVNDDQQVLSRVVLSKAMRKQWRNHQRLLSERLCDICQQRMLQNKDVAALLNTKTGRLICSSRNSTGAFHLFHVSCLIRWILLCEVELYNKHPAEHKTRKRPRKKAKAKGAEQGKKCQMQDNHILSPFCPECQGTGLTVDGEELEKPTIPLSEIFKYKIKLCDGNKAWMKKPEDLQNCSIGFSFPLPAEENMELQEIIAHLKLLHFYRAVL